MNNISVKSDISEITDVEPNSLTIIAAKPGAGKTTVSAFIGLSNALDGKRVLFVSLESSEAQLNGMMDRFISHKGLSKDIQDSFRIVIEHEAPAELEKFESFIRTEISAFQPDMVFVDYLQLLNDSKSKNRTDSALKTTKMLKILHLTIRSLLLRVVKFQVV